SLLRQTGFKIRDLRPVDCRRCADSVRSTEGLVMSRCTRPRLNVVAARTRPRLSVLGRIDQTARNATEDVMTYARHVRFFDLIASLTAAMLVLGMASLARAQEHFKTADAAADALISAAKAGDRNAILHVLGQQATDIVSSGDPVADAGTLQRFIAAYD